MGRVLIECVPNFSEGRDQGTIQAIVHAMSGIPGARVLAYESDPDHNRTVVTLAGAPGAVLEAAFRSVAAAVERIDLNHHSGVHPRIGAADVVPLVPLEGITLEECGSLAHQLGERIWRELQTPVYFYENAAARPDRRRLETIRRGGFEALRREVIRDAARRPDRGGPQLHPTAGAAVVGARKILLAFNVNLETADVQIAKAIARKIRASGGGLPHVKAMGLFLPSRGRAQVSMNLTDFEVTPLEVAFEAVREEAASRGVRIAGSQIVGLMPAKALASASAQSLACENYSPEVILENRLLNNLID